MANRAATLPGVQSGPHGWPCASWQKPFRASRRPKRYGEFLIESKARPFISSIPH
jgi:hypothetical protein